MKRVRKRAFVGVVAALLLQACSGASTPTASTTTPTTTSTSTAPTSSTSLPTMASTLDIEVLSRYALWAERFDTTTRAYAEDLAAENYSAALAHLKEVEALAAAGRKLPPTGNAKADAEWQGAMADLSAFATLAATAVRTRDPDKLMDSLDLMNNVQNHVQAWAATYTGISPTQ